VSKIPSASDPFRAIADPSRRAILDAIFLREKSVTDLSSELPISQPAVSQHLKILKDAGLVSDRKQGRQRFYSMHPEELYVVESWIDKYRSFWNEKQKALEDHLSNQESSP